MLDSFRGYLSEVWRSFWHIPTWTGMWLSFEVLNSSNWCCHHKVFRYFESWFPPQYFFPAIYHFSARNKSTTQFFTNYFLREIIYGFIVISSGYSVYFEIILIPLLIISLQLNWTIIVLLLMLLVAFTFCNEYILWSSFHELYL